METFVKGFLFICLFTFCLIWSVLKNENTLKNQLIIHKAITLYEWDCCKYNIIPKVSKEDVKHYLTAFFALNDWSYKNLLSKKKYKLILPYIPQAKQWIKEVRGNHVRIL